MREHSQIYYLRQLIRTVRNWPVYLLNKYGIIRPARVVYKLHNGLTVTTRSYLIDRGGINEVWLDRIYDPPQFDWASCKTVIDVGANIGTFTLFAAAHAPQARIIALEPEPATADALRRNVTSNHLENRITVDERGGDGTAGERTFFVAPKCSWFSSLYAPPQAGAIPVTIHVTTLEQLFEQYKIDHCDFLKLDCEGAEYDMLYTLPSHLWPRIGFIALEYHSFSPHPQGNPKDLTVFLEQQGYAVTERPNCILYAQRQDQMKQRSN